MAGDSKSSGRLCPESADQLIQAILSLTDHLRTLTTLKPGARKIDQETQIVGFDRELAAIQCPNEHELSEPVEGITFGVAIMFEDAPHGGERHLGGDEVLYLIEGRARLIFTDDPEPDVAIRSGDAVVVPKGLWHRVEILDTCHFVYLTPGHGNEIRAIAPKTSL